MREKRELPEDVEIEVDEVYYTYRYHKMCKMYITDPMDATVVIDIVYSIGCSLQIRIMLRIMLIMLRIMLIIVLLILLIM